ncbi:D-xylose-binding periplasmic protein precursor [Peptococcaceae bacterium CEB3]|nr:D-xylose-binding periplasmic protein precursor [Peptococcaceae bacterium CEB3]
MQKRLRKLGAGLALAALTLLAVSGCGQAPSSGNSGSSGKSSGPKPVIGLSLPTQSTAVWVLDKNQMIADAKKMGIDLRVQVANDDSGQQLSQCESLINQGVKVLIVAPNDAQAAAAIIQQAHAAKIKVISFDRLITGADDDLYVSFDNEKVGELQGKYLTQHAPKGNYIVMSGDPTDNNALLFKKGAMKYIQPLVAKGDVHIVADQAIQGWQPDNAMKIVENALTLAKNNVQGILAPNDDTAGAAIQALAAQGLAGKVVVTGQDATLSGAQRILAGTQSMTVFKDTRVEDQAAMDAALKMAEGKTPATNGTINNGKIEVPSVLLTPVVVDKSNLDKVLIDSGYLKKADVYKK